MVKRTTAFKVTLVGLLIQLPAAAADGCVDEATAYANAKPGKFAAAAFVRPELGIQPIKLVQPLCVTEACPSVYFATDGRGFKLPDGYVPDADYGTVADPKWLSVPITDKTNCPKLRMLAVKPLAATPPASAATEGVNQSAPGITSGIKGANLRQDLEAYHQLRQTQTLRSAPGTAQGLEAITGETLQILGQIVANRASAEAYRLLKHKLEHLLDCDEVPVTNDTGSVVSQSSNPSSAQTSKKRLPKPTFSATCRVLRPLRLQDIATSRDALLGALTQDSLAYLQRVQASLSHGEKVAEQIGAAAIVSAVVIPLIVRPQLASDSAQARAIVGTIQSFVDRQWNSDKITQGAQLALAAGVLAYTRCVDETTKVPNGKLINCDFPAYADSYTGDRIDVQVAARALAAQLMAVATTLNANGQPDVAQRVRHAVDALYGSACMLLESPEAPDPVKLQCPDLPDRIDLDADQPPSLWLSLSQPIVDAALSRDSNALVSSIAHVIGLFSDAEYRASHQRAFLMLGSLMQYSATFTTPNTDNSKELHEQRTKILESLTADMSDRTLRDGDNIWSFGGSLRAVAGARFGKSHPAILSPLGLPLGIGFDHVASGSAAGLHLEFSPIDLGQYVAFDNQAIVKQPELADAVSPSVTIGASWGRSMPLVVGATLGYSPNIYLDPDKNVRGTFNAGLVIGIYVPLIDMN